LNWLFLANQFEIIFFFFYAGFSQIFFLCAENLLIFLLHRTTSTLCCLRKSENQDGKTIPPPLPNHACTAKNKFTVIFVPAHNYGVAIASVAKNGNIKQLSLPINSEIWLENF
jgi:hypothetical protein